MTVDGADTRPGATRIGRAARYGLLIGPSLSMLDSSIVNVAVPDIAQDLRAGLDTVHWVVSGYLLSLAVGLALTAYASRRFGTMRIYLVSMALFVATSAVCALAPSIELLVTARVVQGFVGAPLVPLALSILMGKDGLSGGKVPVSAAVVLFLAPALGPSLGGLLIGAGGWRWVFLVNVPVGVAGLLLALRLRRLGTRARADSRFDPIGFLLLSAGLVTTLLGATRGSASGWGNPAPLALVVAGIGLLAAYVRTSSRRKDPPVRLDVIRSSQSLLALILQVLASVIAFGTVFLIPVFTQQVQGHTALATGLALIPQGIVMGLGTALGQRISTHIPLRTLVTLGFAALAVSSGVMLLLTNDTPLWVTAIMLCGRALAAGFVTTPLLAAFLAPLGEDELADGNTLYNITQRLGGAVGVGILGSMVATGADSGAALAAFHQVGAVLVALALAAGVLARSLSRT